MPVMNLFNKYVAHKRKKKNTAKILRHFENSLTNAVCNLLQTVEAQ